MRTPLRSTRALLAALAALGGSLGTSYAQSVATAPVGAITKTIPVGLTSVGISLINPDLIVASCSSNTASSLSLTGINNVGALLTAGLPYYVEIVAGPLEGERFDVDTAATLTAANSTIVLSTASANNTFTLASGNAAGSTIALRRHVTLAQIQGMCTPALVANDTAALADQIQLLNSAGTAFTAYFLRATNSQWRLVGSPTNANNVVIPPGVGFLLKKVNQPTSIVATGGVRTNDFAFPMPAGLSFRATPYPINYSPASIGGTAALGWTANDTAANADQLQLLNGSGTAFTSYFLRSTGTPSGTVWRLTGSPTAVTNNELFTFNTGFMVSRNQPDNNYILQNPLSL